MECKLIGRAWFTQHDQLIPTLSRILRKNKAGCPKLGKWWQYLPHFRLVSVSDVREQAVIAQVLPVRAQAIFPALKNCNWSCHAHNFKLLIAVIGGFIADVIRRKFQSNLRGGSKVPFQVTVGSGFLSRGAFGINIQIKVCVVRIAVGGIRSQLTCMFIIRKTGIEFRNWYFLSSFLFIRRPISPFSW
jgi:hypothetical protein